MQAKALEAKKIIDPGTGFNFSRHVRFTLMEEEHSHHGFAEIFLLSKGRIGHRLNRVENVLEENSLVFIRPHDAHSFFLPGGLAREQGLELFNLAFPVQTLELALEYLGEAGLRRKMLQAGTDAALVEISEERKSELVRRLLEAGLAASSSPRLAGRRLRQALLELLGCFEGGDKGPGKPLAPQWLSDLCSEFERGDSFRGGLEFLVRKSGYTHEHLCRIFKACFGETPTDYVNRLKLERAASLLAFSDERISMAALNSGFENISHFNHLFRRRYGMSPNAYRKQANHSL